ADLPGEHETRGRTPRPAGDRGLGRQAVEAGVDLGGVEPGRVVFEPARVLCPGRIEGAGPVLVAPARTADAQLAHGWGMPRAGERLPGPLSRARGSGGPRRASL